MNEKTAIPAAIGVPMDQLLEQGYRHFAEENWIEARACLSQVVAVEDGHAELFGILGIVNFRLTDYEASSVAFRRAVQLEPDNAELLIQLAMAKIERGLVAEAEEALRRALKIRPKNLAALRLLAACCVSAGRTDEAKRYQEEITKIDQENGIEDRPPTSPENRPPPREEKLPANVDQAIALDPGVTLEIGGCSYIHDKRIRNPSGAVTHVRIGKFCSIATDLTLIGYDHKTEWITSYPFLDQWHRSFWPGTNGIPFPTTPAFGGNKNRGGIEIGNDVWIGYNVKLFKGISIGDGAVIGACSVVTKSVPPYTIAAGTPCRPIRKRFADADCEFLQTIKWWDWSREKINHHLPLLCSTDIAQLRERLRTESTGR